MFFEPFWGCGQNAGHLGVWIGVRMYDIETRRLALGTLAKGMTPSQAAEPSPRCPSGRVVVRRRLSNRDCLVPSRFVRGRHRLGCREAFFAGCGRFFEFGTPALTLKLLSPGGPISFCVLANLSSAETLVGFGGLSKLSQKRSRKGPDAPQNEGPIGTKL